MEIIKPDVNIDFVGKRLWAFVVSGLLVLITILSLVMHGGPNYGIDFVGGIEVRVRFTAPTEPAAVKSALRSIGMGDSVVQGIGEDSDREFRILDEREGLALEGLPEKVTDTLKKAYGDKFEEVRYVRTVGPKVGRDLRDKALKAILFAILLIAVYISGRFEAKWFLAGVMAALLVGAVILVQTIMATGRGGAGSAMVILIITALVVTVGACWLFRLRYAMGAIVALLHDVIITVGVFSVLDKEFTLATVAALLTIIGYSLNDTIIVYDRIRENLKKGGRKEMSVVINEAVNQTLSRTILTSGTTLMVLLSLFILGGGVIQDFALALLVGVIVGTYSSVFVASPVLLAMPQGGGIMSWLSPSAKSPSAKAAKAKPAPDPKPQAKEEPKAEPKKVQEARPAAASRAKKLATGKKKKKGKKKRR